MIAAMIAWVRRLLLGLPALVRRKRHVREWEEEWDSYLACATEQKEESGMDRVTARRAAQAAFGSPDAMRERMLAAGWEHRLEQAARDLRHGWRSLRRNPAASLVIVLTLAMGVGGNCLAFAWIYAATMRPLAFPQAQRLVWMDSTARGIPAAGISGPDLQDWQPRLDAMFEGHAILRGQGESTWRMGDMSWEASRRRVSGNFFALLGVRAQAGRLLLPSDAAAGQGAVVVLSYDFWERQFGGNLAVLGRTMSEQEGDYPAYTIVGVLPPSFAWESTADIWVPEQPLATFVARLRTSRPFYVVGRLRTGTSLAAAQAGVDGLAQAEAAAHPSTDAGWRMELKTLDQHEHGGGAPGLVWLCAAAGCLLLIGCVNVAHLLLARGQARQGEMAMHMALGASRGHIVAQLLTESALLAAGGAVLGWAGAAAALQLLRVWGGWLLPAAVLRDMVGLHATVLAPWVVAYTAGSAAAVVLLCGLAPALQALGAPLRSEAAMVCPGATRKSWANGLVAAEVALTMMLMVGAGLLLHGWLRLANVNPGFARSQRLSFLIQLPFPMTVGSAADGGQKAAWWQLLEQRLQAAPGVSAAGAANDFPVLDPSGGWIIERSGKTLPELTMAHVTPGYFAAMGAPIVSGSDFPSGGDLARGAKAVILNQRLAALLFPGQNPVGLHVALPRCGINVQSIPTPKAAAPASCVVIGVARDLRYELAKPAPPTMYFDMAQDPGLAARFVLVARGDVASVEAAARAVVAGMPSTGAQAPYMLEFETLRAGMWQALAEPRLQGWLAGMLAGLALLLAAIGILGVTSYSVGLRTREFGVRLALGATRGQVLRLVTAGSARWTLLGIAFGLAGGALAAQALATRLAGLSPWDPVTMIAAPALLLTVALLASLGPARRATRVDPATALRAE
ncbi:MAG TPA: ADOP family duplicated permease [Terriglobales bacterium]|nr:ADOP family duplicated permease [Terriglobales bacterium]